MSVIIRVWAAVIMTAALLILFGVPFEAVMGTITFAAFAGWILVEFLNLRLFVRRIFARLFGAPYEPDGVDRTLAAMDRSTHEYANTRNAEQQRKAHNG